MIPKFYRLMTYESKQLRNRILKPKYLEYKNILIISIFLYYKIFRLFRQRSIIADAPAELSLVLLNYRFCCRRTRLRNWTGTELPLILVLNPHTCPIVPTFTCGLSNASTICAIIIARNCTLTHQPHIVALVHNNKNAYYIELFLEI